MPAVGQPLRAATATSPWIQRWTTAGGWTAALGTNLTSSTVDASPSRITLPNFEYPGVFVACVGAFEAGAAAASPVQWRLVLYDRAVDVVVGGVQGGSADFPGNMVNATDNVPAVLNDRDLRVHVPLMFDLRGIGSILPARHEWFLCVSDIGIAEEAYLFSYRFLRSQSF